MAVSPTQVPMIDLGNWTPSDVSYLQNYFAIPTTTPPVPATTGGEFVSTNPYQSSGLDAINYNIWQGLMPEQTGQVFRFDTGNDIGVPDGNGGWTYRNAGQVVFQPGETYQMTDKSGKVIGTASTPEEMQALVDKSADVSFYNLERTTNPNPGVELGGMMPSKTDAGSLGSMLVNMAALALPVAGGAALGPVLAGSLGTSAAVGTGLGTAIGTAAAGTAAGKSIEDILLQSALAGITAGGLSAITGPKGMPDIGDLQAQVIDGTMSVAQATKALQQAGATASQIAQFAADVGAIGSSAFPTVIGNVGGALSGIGTSAGAALGGVTGGLTGALTGAGGSTYDPRTNTNTVTGQQTAQPSAPAVVPIVTPPTTLGGYDPINNVITAVGDTPQSVADAENQIGVGVPPITSVNIPPNAGTTLPDTGGSLLNDILKYYSLGSGVLDMLGVGKGGAGPTTPYTSVLGNVPTFGRGAFQPFTGDYETYAQGPEWNFFGTNNG